MDAFKDAAENARRLAEAIKKSHGVFYVEFDGKPVNLDENPFYIFGGSKYYSSYDSNQTHICMEDVSGHTPRAGFIDAGIVLTEGFQVTHEMAVFEDVEEYKALTAFIDAMPNLIANEMLPGRMYWVYD